MDSATNENEANLLALLRLSRRAWLFASSELTGRRAVIVMSLVQLEELQGHDPWGFLKDVLTQLPVQLNSRIDELLSHN